MILLWYYINMNNRAKINRLDVLMAVLFISILVIGVIQGAKI